MEHQQQQNTLLVKRHDESVKNVKMELRALRSQIATLVSSLQAVESKVGDTNQDMYERSIWCYATSQHEISVSENDDSITIEPGERVLLVWPCTEDPETGDLWVTLRRVHDNGAVTETPVPFFTKQPGISYFTSFSLTV
jgi:hypothetical protein